MRALYLQMHELQSAKHDRRKDAASQSPQLLLVAGPSTSGPLCTSYRLNPMMDLHFYTSAQPCGNASVKRWAKGQPEHWHDLPADQLPHLPHERITLHARKEGQAMFLVKRFRPAAQVCDTSGAVWLPESPAPSPGMTQVESSQVWQSCMQQKVAKYVPHACAQAKPGNGQTASCSDKIARWNVLGVQGGLMLNLLSEPIYIDSITIGHKYVLYIRLILGI